MLPHDKSWEREFLVEKERILSELECSSLRIAHVGSTAIPGISAKPVIDIAVEVKGNESIERIRESLEKLGYEYFGDRKLIGDYFFANGPEEKRTHYLHVSIEATQRFEKYVLFRDALRADKEMASKYDSLKSELIKKFPNDRESYTQAKTSFIEEVTDIYSNQSLEVTPLADTRIESQL